MSKWVNLVSEEDRTSQAGRRRTWQLPNLTDIAKHETSNGTVVSGFASPTPNECFNPSLAAHTALFDLPRILAVPIQTGPSSFRHSGPFFGKRQYIQRLVLVPNHTRLVSGGCSGLHCVYGSDVERRPLTLSFHQFQSHPMP